MDNNYDVPNVNTPNVNNSYNGFNNNPNYEINNGFNNNINSNMNNNKKRNDTFILLGAFIVVAVIVLVVVMAVTGVFDSSNEDDSPTNEVVEKKEDNVSSSNLYEHSEYENYKFNMYIVMEVDGLVVNTTSTGHADVKNKTDMMTTIAKAGNITNTSYSYSDYASGTVYTSYDKVSWEESETTGEESINLKDIITKINDNSTDVTKLSDNHFSVKVDYASGSSQYNGVYADVYVSNGYITKLSYDLTSIVAGDGFTKFTVDLELSDFNEAGDVVIPESVINSGMSSI